MTSQDVWLADLENLWPGRQSVVQCPAALAWRDCGFKDSTLRVYGEYVGLAWERATVMLGL